MRAFILLCVVVGVALAASGLSASDSPESRSAAANARNRAEPGGVSSADADSQWAPAALGNYEPADRPDDYAIEAIVIHVAQGSTRGVISTSQDPHWGVSPHYVVGRDGAITKLVREGNIAYHAGNPWYNRHSIGIEHEGYVENRASFTPAMYRASAALVREICARYGIPRDRKHIVGHVEVPDANHTDPGPYWDWGLYLRLIREA